MTNYRVISQDAAQILPTTSANRLSVDSQNRMDKNVQAADKYIDLLTARQLSHQKSFNKNC